MKHISELTNVSCLNEAREKTINCEILDPLCVALVNALFIKFGLLCREYDAMYADPKRENAEKVQWVRAFIKYKLKTQAQIQAGIDKTEKHKYGKPPQLGQFLEWCERTPESCGFPEILNAFKIACSINSVYGTYIHSHVPTDTVIRHAVNQIGSNQFREMSEKDAIKLFSNYYIISCRQYMDGNIKDILRSLPEKHDLHPIDREKSNEARLIAMKAMINMGLKITQKN